ncbi:MAG: glycosyltransferase family 4 protein [Bradyrhizobium sp.]|nr:glycosyltransferase family 4 protein [Bradyrhizobium sp.]
MRLSRAPTQKILWAGRLDRQKRVDLLAAVAKAMPSCRFLVFGSVLLSTDTPALRSLRKLPNVEMKVAYDGFHSLPVEECDLLLYTSQWDGLPNVISEAAAHGLPIVTSNVGGIAEMINEQTGYLVEPYDSVPAFVAAISRIIENRQEALERAANALEIVRHRHNAAAFRESLEALPGYLPSDSGKTIELIL